METSVESDKEKKARDIFDRIIKKPTNQSPLEDEFRKNFLKEMYIVEK